MAITAIEYKLIHDLRRTGTLPTRPHVIEFGESNWYGDVPYERLAADIDQFVEDEGRREEYKRELARHAKALEDPAAPDDPLWDVAKIFFRTFLDYSTMTAIDLGGMETALKLDLNEPVTLGRQYDVAFDFGTAEHIFNVYQFFKTVHEAVRPGGFMIHGLPFVGWIDHGFYNFQPTFFWDLAEACGYRLSALLYGEVTPPKMIQIRGREEIVGMVQAGQFGPNGMLFAVYQKKSVESSFRIPMQGYYAGAVSDQVKAAWASLR